MDRGWGEGAFGGDADYAQLHKICDAATAALGRFSLAECVGIQQRRVEGSLDPKHVSTSYVERQNLTMHVDAPVYPAHQRLL